MWWVGWGAVGGGGVGVRGERLGRGCVRSERRTNTVHSSSPQVLREFLDTFDVGGEKDGKVTRNEFENYYKNISASIDNDDYFELMMRNAWHISGGEGWCANSSNKRVLVTDSQGKQSVVEIKNDLGLDLIEEPKEREAEMIKRLKKQGVDVAKIDTGGSTENESSKKKANPNFAKSNVFG